MYAADPLKLCVEVFKLYHIRLQLFAPPYTNASDIDFGLREILSPGYDYPALLERIRSLLHPGEVVYLQDRYGISYNAFSLEGGPVECPYLFGVAGPWKRDVSYEQILCRIREVHSLEEEASDALLLAIKRIPENISRNNWISLLTRTVGRLISPDGDIRFYSPGTTILNLPAFVDPQNLGDAFILSKNRKGLEGAYEYEQLMVEAVKNGNYPAAEDNAHKFLNYQMHYFRDFHLSEKAAGFGLNSLLRHTAQEAGVNALRLDEIYVKFIKLIEREQNEIPYMLMLRDYCDMVRLHSHRQYSPVIRQCIDYIDFFYMEDISLQTLSARCSVSEPYLASLFRKELGLTMTDYLNRRRVEQAKEYLQKKEHSVSTIAAMCGYNDASYFCRVFKKQSGISPRDYRQRKMLQM